MKHWLPMLVLTALIPACGPSSNTYVLEETNSAESNQTNSANAENAKIGLPSIEGKGLDFRLYKELESDPTKQRPSFRIHAETGGSDKNTNYMLTNPRAVIFDKDGEEIVITADTGDFDQTNEIANLEGNVLLLIGNKQIKTNKITWENGPEIAYTEEGATLTSDTIDLTAQSLTLMPATSQYRMESISGSIDISRDIKLKEVH